MDTKDKKILSLLDRNARTSIIQIAKKTRLNKDVVRYRINNLEKEKVIQGYYTIIDSQKLGLITFRIYLDFINLAQESEKKLISYLDKEFKAGQIFTIDGPYQLGVITLEESIYKLEVKIQNLKKQFGDYINNLEISIFTKLNHYFKKSLPLSTNEIIPLKQEEKIKVDDLDLKILKELSKNSRASYLELSKRLQIPQRTLAYRIKNLEKNKIILAYRADIDISRLGYENYFIEIYTGSKQNLKLIEGFAHLSKNCIYSDFVLPGADIELEMEFRNKQELLDFINELKEKFHFIKKIRYWSTLQYIKVNYLPG
ncbi:Lrp/AsnC family transcriptional regulator [Candidatus Woesearchaeota archaeon]|nr:Lrp/AsnC family transcriptional regulator [Candidatus Woesearchaeota archaeon]